MVLTASKKTGHILFLKVYFWVKKYVSVFQNSKADFDIICYNVSVTSPSILSKILKKDKNIAIYILLYKLCKKLR